MTYVFILMQVQHTVDFDVEIQNKVFKNFDEAVEELKADINFLTEERSVLIENDYNNTIDYENEYATYNLKNNFSSYHLTIEKHSVKGGEINGD